MALDVTGLRHDDNAEIERETEEERERNGRMWGRKSVKSVKSESGEQTSLY